MASNKNKHRVILWLLLAVWMTIIFSFSAMDATASGRFSSGIAETAVKIIVPQYNDLSRDRQIDVLDQADHLVRKTAHASEYAILGILTGLLLLSYRKSYRFVAPLALLICAAYAASDEAHQILVSGRSPQVTDVLIDTGGAVIGIVLLVLIARRLRDKKVGKLLR